MDIEEWRATHKQKALLLKAKQSFHNVLKLLYFYPNGDIERFEELKYSLLVDRLSMVCKFIVMSLFLKITFK